MRWLITGAARGLGAAFTFAALEAGHHVCAAVRDLEKLGDLSEAVRSIQFPDHLLVAKMDVTKPEEVWRAVEDIRTLWGGLDVLVNNAGFGMLGMFEELSREEWQQQFAVNFFGCLEVTRAALPLLRTPLPEDGKQGSKVIFTISSIAGLVGIAGFSAYCSSKFALEGWMECLRQEVQHFGVKCCTVEPGFFRTEFTQPIRSLQAAKGPLLGIYAGQRECVNRQFSEMQQKLGAGDPRKLAQALVSLAAKPHDEIPAHFLAGTDAVDRCEKEHLAQRVREVAECRALSCGLAFDAAEEKRRLGSTAGGGAPEGAIKGKDESI